MITTVRIAVGSETERGSERGGTMQRDLERDRQGGKAKRWEREMGARDGSERWERERGAREESEREERERGRGIAAVSDRGRKIE